MLSQQNITYHNFEQVDNLIFTCKYGGDLVSLEEVLDPEPAPDGEHGDLDVDGVVAGGELLQVDGEDVALALHYLVHQHLGSLVPVPGKVPAAGKRKFSGKY